MSNLTQTVPTPQIPARHADRRRDSGVIEGRVETRIRLCSYVRLQSRLGRSPRFENFHLKFFVSNKSIDLSFIFVCFAVKEALKSFHATYDQKYMSGKSMKGGCGFFIL